MRPFSNIKNAFQFSNHLYHDNVAEMGFTPCCTHIFSFTICASRSVSFLVYRRNSVLFFIGFKL
jgi:hypothetical protein